MAIALYDENGIMIESRMFDANTCEAQIFDNMENYNGGDFVKAF